MSEDTPGRVVSSPDSEDPSYVPPPIPLYRDATPEPDPGTSPESPQESTLELPIIPTPAPLESFLASEGIPTPSPPTDSGSDEERGGEFADYSERRSLADRIGDWLEYRIALGRSRAEAEVPFREAKIAEKVARMKARTSRELGLMEQQNKLRQAQVAANAARTAAQGKASATGMGADKGLRKPSPRPTGSPGRSGSGASNAGTNGRTPGASAGRTGGGTRGSGNAGNASKGASGGRSGVNGGQQAAGGSRGRQSSAGGHGGAPGAGTREAGGRNASAGGAERVRAREERRSARQAAGLQDRTKDRDLARQRSQTAWEDRRARTAQRHAERASAAAAPGRVTLGKALADEAEQRWENRRAQQTSAPTPPKVDLTKKPRPGGKTSPPSDGGEAAAPGPGGAAAPGPGGKTPPGPGGNTPSGPGTSAPRDTDEPEPEVVSPGRFYQPPRDTKSDDVTDAEIVEPAALPAAPERHTQRPGTSRPTTQETEGRPMGGQQGMAAQHRTEVNFDEYLVEIANIAVAAEADKEEASELADALSKVAEALEAMAADLADDHNINSEVTGLIAHLAEAAKAMKAQADRWAAECEEASIAAGLVARAVAQTYGEDLNAMDRGGVSQASAAAHHD